MNAVTQFVEDLPPPIATDVVGYARSVQAALPDIFRDAGMSIDQSIGDQLVFLAGVRKLESIVSSQYWILDNSLHFMAASDVRAVRYGPQVLSLGSDYYERLREAVGDLERLLVEAGLTEFLSERSHSQLARALRDGR